MAASCDQLQPLARKHRRAEVLLVDDNPADLLLKRQAFELTGVEANLHQATDGRECMEFLRQQGRFADVPRPDIVLLDLNEPYMDGRQVLAEIVADDALMDLLVVVLTTSSAPEDLRNMYRLRCNSYIVKASRL